MINETCVQSKMGEDGVSKNHFIQQKVYLSFFFFFSLSNIWFNIVGQNENISWNQWKEQKTHRNFSLLIQKEGGSNRGNLRLASNNALLQQESEAWLHMLKLFLGALF